VHNRLPIPVLLLVAFLAGALASAQDIDPGVRRPFPRPPSKSAPQEPDEPMYIGGFLGAQRTWSRGSFKTLCNCEYNDGSGYGPAFGVLLEYPLTPAFLLAGELRYADFSTSYSVRETRTEFILSRGVYEQVEFERNADIDLAQVSVAVFAVLRTGPAGLFLFAGPRIGVPLRSQIDERERVLTPGFAYGSGGTGEKSFAQGGMNLLWNTRAVRIDAVAGIGARLPLTPRLLLEPRASYAYPFTSVVKEHSSWTLSALDLTLGLLFAL
jgi:hypothetical protein